MYHQCTRLTKYRFYKKLAHFKYQCLRIEFKLLIKKKKILFRKRLFFSATLLALNLQFPNDRNKTT